MYTSSFIIAAMQDFQFTGYVKFLQVRNKSKEHCCLLKNIPRIHFYSFIFIKLKLNSLWLFRNDYYAGTDLGRGLRGPGLEGFFNSTHHGQFEKNLTQTTWIGLDPQVGHFFFILYNWALEQYQHKYEQIHNLRNLNIVPNQHKIFY